MNFTTKALDPDTWPDFTRLAEAHHGVWGCCCCMGFHAKGPGWGVSAELPRIKNAAAYRAAATAPAQWRITCVFPGKSRRGNGVGRVAQQGALDQITRLGGGLVEAFPEDTAGRKAGAACLFNGSLSMFETAGFSRSRQIGNHKWLVSRSVAAFP